MTEMSIGLSEMAWKTSLSESRVQPTCPLASTLFTHCPLTSAVTLALSKTKVPGCPAAIRNGTPLAGQTGVVVPCGETFTTWKRTSSDVATLLLIVPVMRTMVGTGREPFGRVSAEAVIHGL